MSKSATVLGQLYGVTGQVMNVILKELGYLEGDPGAYRITEKGAKYAFERDHHRGTGGYGWYNRDWTTRTWGDGIVDELHVTDDLKNKAQEVVSAARRRLAETVADDIGTGAGAVAEDSLNATGNGRRVAVVAAGAAILAGSAYGIYKAAPHAKKLLDEKIVPGLKDIKNKVLRKSDGDPGCEPGAAEGLSGGVEADPVEQL
ncbi:hypothetical protein AB0B71_16235 [Micromonospora echinofusca]|uniref:hypothetical protein n=1 Tax=Micromonospora echinofusca TaxID=47858 RepID=UPI0033EB2D74